MKEVFSNIFRNSSTRIMLILFVSLIGIVAYFLINSYYSHLAIYENKVLTKVNAIASTLSAAIDGDAHQDLFERYKHQDDILNNYQDSAYMALHLQLLWAQKANGLNTDIYTMVKDEMNREILFCISTSEEPFFRHKYESYPEFLYQNYEIGGQMPPYADDHGHWLSAFAPIKNSEGDVIAVLQIDEKYDDYINAANEEIVRNILISLGIMLAVAFILIRSIRSILKSEQEIKADLISSKKEIEEKNRDITDSIHYAKRIQDAIAPAMDRIRRSLPDSFVLYLPRDIVSGDFYWFTQKDDKIIIAAVDCTGHGVPGAFMSMIGSMLLSEIVNQQGVTEPAKILDMLDKRITGSLRRKDAEVESNDGMDVSLCAVDKHMTTLEYAGAYRPLVHVRDGEVSQISGDKFAIGGSSSHKTAFTNNTIELQKGDTFYIFSDGYPDQFGGEKGKKFMSKKLKQEFLDIQSMDMERQRARLHEVFEEWRGGHEQVDDVLVIGFRI